MTVDNVEIVDFCEIKSLSFSPGAGATLLVASNGSGKSSALEAIRLALNGWCAWTDRRGGGAMTLVRDGARQSTISLLLSNKGKSWGVTLNINAHGKQAMQWQCIDGDGVEVENRDALWTAMGVPREKSEAISYIEDALASGAFGNLLAAALCDALPLSKVLDHCGDHREWFEAFAKRYALGAAQNPEDYKALGDKAYEIRTGQKKELAERKPELSNLFVMEPLDGRGCRISESDLPRLQRCASELATAREKLIEERGRCSLGLRSVDTVEKDYDAAQKRLAKLTAEHTAAAAESERLSTAQENARELVRSLTNQESALRGEITRAEMTVAVFKDGVCPKCATKLNKAKLSELTGDTERQLAEARTKHAAITEDIEQAKRDRDDTETAYREQCLKTAKLQEAVNAESQTVGKLEYEQAASVRTVEDVARDMDALDAEAETINGYITGVQAFKARQELETFVGELETEIAHLDWCVQSFKDGVLLKSLAKSDKRKKFLDALNAELAAFGYSCELQQDKKRLDLWLGRIGGVLRPLHRRSTGEQCLAHIAVALVYGGGRAPVLIDNVECLDRANTEILRQRVQTLDSTVILAFATGRFSKEAIAEARRAWGKAQIVLMERREDGAKAVANG